SLPTAHSSLPTLPLPIVHRPAPTGIEEQRTLFRPAPVRAMNDQARLRITPRHFAYLKISDGCDRLCTFCAIPGMRGKHVTKPIEEVLREARELAADGVRELILVAQDTTYYGLDLYGKVRLAELLRELDQVDGLDWIRILYTYPIHFTDELIETLAKAEKILPYLDLPLQHINDTMLRRMQRRVTRAQTEDLLARLRAAVPGLVLRTTFIVGFPGETEEHFEHLLRFVEEVRFDHLGAFVYSPEEGTPGAELSGRVPRRVARRRWETLLALQRGIALERRQRLVGRRLTALVEGVCEETEHLLQARHHGMAPEVDGRLLLNDGFAPAGTFATVEITDAFADDLVGRILDVASAGDAAGGLGNAAVLSS
ncbi:MAG: 30S ribosomal protein S12 methylthiotransferase RimO, partial [bacterium]